MKIILILSILSYYDADLSKSLSHHYEEAPVLPK